MSLEIIVIKNWDYPKDCVNENYRLFNQELTPD
jgi:hypothetical protein